MNNDPMQRLRVIGVLAAVCLFSGCATTTDGARNNFLVGENGAKLEVTEKTMASLVKRLGADVPMEFEEVSVASDDKEFRGHLYLVACKKHEVACLFCYDGREWILSDAESISAYFQKTPSEITAENICEMISFCRLIRWPSYVLRLRDDPSGFGGGQAGDSDFRRCVGNGPMLIKRSENQWEAEFRVLYRNGGVDHVTVKGDTAPFAIRSIETRGLMPPGSFGWNFLGTIQMRGPTQPPLPTPPSLTPAADAPVPPPPGTAGR